ncbi:MAG TPA: TetR family transcriptional regulator [Mycobacteriales bacterium]|nr:TetR family transcriptional regulator [Mycobacteriales bacterium]
MRTRRNRGRTQAERTAATRKALIDATVTSLVERGFTRTTTTNVVKDARVSLGALSHHFPSKTELMTATVAHLLERRQGEFREQVAAVGAGPDRVEKAIDALWAAFSGPTFVAWVELWVGGRRDPELASAVLDMQDQFMTSSRELFAELFPPQQYAGTGLDERSMALAFAVMEGVALKSIAGDPADTAPVDLLKLLARTRITDPGAAARR